MTKHYNKLGIRPPANLKIYQYRYEFTNRSEKAALQMNFSGGRMHRSPLFEIIQGFSIEVPPGRTYEIDYYSLAPPDIGTAPNNVGAREKGAKRWEYSGMGRSTFFYPDIPTLHQKHLNGLIPLKPKSEQPAPRS